MTPATPSSEHDFLKFLLGTWTFDTGAGPERHFGTAHCRTLGGLWYVLECTGEYAGGGWTSQFVLGYDPAQGKYIGTFVGSTMNELWVYRGDRVVGTNAIVLNTEGPKFSGTGRTEYRDTFTLNDENGWTLSSELLDDEGNWKQFMSIPHVRANA